MSQPPLNIYFAASIWGAPGDDSFCRGVIQHLRQYGTVLSEKLFEPNYKSAENLDVRAIHDRDLNWIRQADWIVADVSVPSLGVGYEIREAVMLQKPILGLYRVQPGKKLSAMIAGSPGVHMREFNDMDGALRDIDEFYTSHFSSRLA